MNILIACEESQVECIAFRKKGHNAFSCDLQPCSGGHPEWHIQGDVLDILNPQFQHYGDWVGDCAFIEFMTMDGDCHAIMGRWDMIIAHPPCTYLALSSAPEYAKAGGEEGWCHKEMINAVNFFYAFLNADCDKIVVENPRVMARTGLPPHTQMVSPHQFGSDYSKRTCYWIKGLPPLIQTVRTLNPSTCQRSSWYNNFRNADERRRNRSKSFPEIAEAMAQQWG